MTTLEVLRLARAEISDPANWQKQGGHGPNGERCAAVAIYDAGGGIGSIAERVLIQAIFGTAPTHDPVDLFDWNDDPATTHADVLAAFDKAIAAEEARATV